jgi:hypothetical protein
MYHWIAESPLFPMIPKFVFNLVRFKSYGKKVITLLQLHWFTSFQQPIDAVQFHSRVWGHSIGENLPKEYAKCPDIGFCAECVVGKAFWGSPCKTE